jgi:monoamine oxidase
MSHSTDILIIGAGVTGLAAACNRRHSDLDMTILEARDRIGGRTLSIRT